MSFERAKNYLKEKGFEDRIMVFEVSSATVELAAVAANTTPEKIAKSLTFYHKNNPIMIVCAGDRKIDNSKFKAIFQEKATMIAFDDVEKLVGHAVGGVCPFGINQGVDVYLDESLKRFDYVYPACGDSKSAVKLTPDELDGLSNQKGWIDVSK